MLGLIPEDPFSYSSWSSHSLPIKETVQEKGDLPRDGILGGFGLNRDRFSPSREKEIHDIRILHFTAKAEVNSTGKDRSRYSEL